MCRRFEGTGTFVTGCKNFKLDSLKAHSTSQAHKDNVTRLAAEHHGGSADEMVLKMNENEKDCMLMLCLSMADRIQIFHGYAVSMKPRVV